jgi:tetratricopeptide (TPR) repeat protein
MARLKVLLRGAQISDLALDVNREYLAGRKESCDIKLQAEKGISREHFKLKFQDGSWTVQSLSRFGEIYSGGLRIEKMNFEHGTSFQVPPYEFQFRDLPQEEFNDVSQKHSAIINETDRTVVGVSPQAPYIKMMSSTGEVKEMLRLESGDVWVAGRDSSCQIVIADQRVSRKQYEIRKINGVFTIIDLNSVNGTFLNGSPISAVDPQTLKSGDSIGVLDNVMYFELHDPNFKFKVDKIEIPQINLTEKELSISPSEFENMTASSAVVSNSQISQSQVSSLSQVSHASSQQGSPLMLQQVEEPYTQQQPNLKNYGQNQKQQQQYYQFRPGQGQQAPPPQSSWKKFTANKPLFFTVVLLVLGAAFYVSEMLDAPTPKTAVKEPLSADPFSRLSSEQKKTVQDMFNLAQKAMLQSKYSFAIENLKKLHEILPTGYQDSKSMLDEATLNEQTISQKLEQERLDKIRAEQDLEIQATGAKCQLILNRQITIEKMRDCLAPIAQIDPTNNEYTRLMAEAEKIISDMALEAQRKADEELKRNPPKPVEKDLLADLFKKAEDYKNSGRAHRAIKAYLAVINSEHKDLKEYKPRAEEMVAFIQSKLQEKIDVFVAEAEIPIKDGRLKEAIAILRQGLDVDPNNEDLNARIKKNVVELKNQLKIIYQESIIDENYGNLEGDDTRQGAKQKWKKIIETDIEDGEYYRKAFTKLNRYGVF